MKSVKRASTPGHRVGPKPARTTAISARRLKTSRSTPNTTTHSRRFYASQHNDECSSSSEDLAPVPQHLLFEQGKLSTSSVRERVQSYQAPRNHSQTHHPTTNASAMGPHPSSLSQPSTFNAMFPPSLLTADSNNNINNPFSHYSSAVGSNQTTHPNSPQPHTHLPPRNIFCNVTSVPVPDSFLITPDQFETQTDPQDQYSTYLHADSSPSFNKPIRSVLLIKKWNSKQATIYSNHIADYLAQQNIQVFVEPSSINDYNADYPSIFELMHNVDVNFHNHLPDAFPSLVDTPLASSSTSLVHQALQREEQDERENAQQPLPRFHNTETPRYSETIDEILQKVKSKDFWKNYERPASLKSRFLPLAQRECIPFIRKYEKWQEFIDIVVAVGGDGTLLHVSTLFSHQVPPVLGFSCGSFGFLMPFNPDRAEQAIDKVLKGGMRYQKRNRLFFKVQQNQTLSEKQQFPINQFDPDCFHLLNEVTLKHSYNLNSSASVSDLECRVNGHLLARYQGDGLILATPTGSTAYSLAAGGSIIHPSMNCILITPIAPMTLSSRPVIIPSDSIVTLSPVSSPVLLEGKYGRVVHPGESIIISSSKFPIPVFCRRDATSDFMQDLGSRLNYSRMFRFKRESDDITDLPQGQAGVFLSKRHEM